MSFRQWFAAHRSLVLTATSGIVIAAVVAAVAVVSTGFTAQRLDLNDSSVWVANGTEQVIGRANTEILALNTVVTSAGSEMDVLQSGASVLLFDRTNSKADIIDPATSKVLDSVPLPPDDPQLFLAGDNVVVGSGGSGEYWIVRFADFARFDAQSPPTLSLGADSVASVNEDGVLFVFSAATKQVNRVDAASSDVVSSSTRAAFGNAQSRLSITSVGDQWVLLDATALTIFTSRGLVSLAARIGAGSAPVLQQPVRSGDSVLLSYSAGMFRIPLGGGDPVAVVEGRDGLAVAPVIVDGCTFAAWSDGSGWRRCGSTDPAELSLASLPSNAARLTFDHNGDRVVLNDPRGGGTWAVQREGQLIDNWAELITVRRDQQQVQENDEDVPPEYEKAQLPPVAVNDAFGARPGRATVLPVLLNDYDPNGDVLVVTDFDTLDEGIGRLDLISDHQQLQLTLSAGASGSFSFGYSVSDGRGGTARATVTVTVRQPAENAPPQQVRKTKALVATGGRVTTSVLGDWIDPDGDAFYLASAATALPDTVTYKPGGNVDFAEGGSSGPLRSVALVVSDGRANGTGSLTVTVRAPGQVPIIADPFVVLTYSGQEVTVSPLEHVRGGTGVLRLASVPAKTGVTITPSLDAGTFRFSSAQVGTHYLEYVVNDGDQTATGELRVDVAAPPDANTRPITIPKTVFVKTLSSETIDVAASDIDPAGGVLLVTSIYNVPPASGVRAEAIEQRAIRITLTAPLDAGPVGFNYRVTNGLAEAEGLVTVVEIPRPARLQPPVANDDSVTLRVGDAINIPVLDNDLQPDGEELTLNPLLSTALQGNSGLLFASGNVLRYLAPQKTGDFTAVYQVSGPDGQVAQAQVKISVREAVQATNNPPVPATVVGRVLAGQTTRISIPLAGIDPDGDSVQLLGQETSPVKGSVIRVGTDYIDYEAGDYSAGTDTFTYTVVDALGARATGMVRVGINPKRDSARNPVAIEDEVTIRPGGTVSVQVLANDSDPDGGTLKVTKIEPNTRDVTAKIVGDIVKVTPPRTEGRYGLVYTIENEYGGTSSNFLTVVVDPNAPHAYPVIEDTVLTLSDILGRDSIDVNVLRNAFFADGEVSQLGVSLLPGYSESATVTPSKRIRVAIDNKSQIIPFALAHPQDPSIVAYAFVWVPGLDDALPQLNRKAPALTVASEAELRIDLDDYVLAIGGKKVRLTDSTTVKATNSNGASLVVNDHTLRFTSADKYFGPASISFEVTDGTSATDPNGRKATLVLPIRVTPRENQPPAFVGGVIEFEPGQSKEIDLVRLTNYPYPDDADELGYTVLSPLPVGFSYTLTGQSLVLRANEDAVKNTTTAISIGVKDDLSTGQAGRIQLNVVASSRPLAKPAADTAIATRGQSTSVAVLANDEATNPFPGQPLKVVAIRGLDGLNLPEGVSVTPNADRSQLAVTVANSAVPGDTNLQYQVADATNDPDRYVWGTIRISVQDRPDPVTTVQPTAFGDRSITLRWSPGNANNSPITGYEVTMLSPAGDTLSTTSCEATVCEIATRGNGPDNGVRLRVIAKNAIGSSDPVVTAGAVWSDIIPAAPGINPPEPLDNGLRITWSPVTTPSGGSAVNNYVVIAGAVSLNFDPAGCAASCTVDVGLPGSNGQQIAVSVSARNSAYAPLASWNSSETTGVPAGPPLAVGTVSATASDTSIAVDWAGVFADNGRPVTDYQAERYTGAQPSCPAGNPGTGAATSTTFPANSDSVYSIVVFAWNSQGCTSSAPVVAHTPPGVVTDAHSGGPSQHGENFDLTLQDASIGGTSLNADYSVYYRFDGSGDGSGPVSIGGFLSGAPYGQDVSVQLRACRTFPDGAVACQGSWSASIPLSARAVDPHVSGVSFTPGTLIPFVNGHFDWLGWPAGSYENVQYSCGGALNEAVLSDPGGSCDVSPANSDPELRIRITANGGQIYEIKYDQNGNVRP